MKKNNNLFASLKTEDCHYINYFGSEICLDTPHQLSANKTCIVFSFSKNIGQISINLKFPLKIDYSKNTQKFQINEDLCNISRK